MKFRKYLLLLTAFLILFFGFFFFETYWGSFLFSAPTVKLIVLFGVSSLPLLPFPPSSPVKLPQCYLLQSSHGRASMPSGGVTSTRRLPTSAQSVLSAVPPLSW